MPDLVDAVGGDRIGALEALRDLLAERLEKAGPRDTASLAKQLGDVLRELADLKPSEESDSVDEIARKRAARRAASGVL